VRRGAQRFGRQLVATNADMSGRIIEALTHHRLVRAFGTETHEATRFAANSEALRRATLRTELLKGIANPATELLYVPLMFVAIGLGLALGLGMPTLLAYLLILYRLQPHLRHIDTLRVELASFGGPVEDIVTILEMQDPTAPRSGTRPVPAIRESIRFEQVSFDYGTPDAAGLAGVSFEIPKGAVVALVGPSGAGKSTAVGLLYRFFDPTAGQILVDGIPLTQLDLAAWRQRLAFAGQDIELMGGSVRDNIAYGSPSASDAEIVAAARQAHADAFIGTLPQGYASEVGGRGLSLSGGQRQRLTIARALLRKPDLLILDEATNALDADSEGIVLERVNEMAAGMTMLVIAHRLSTVQNADLVVVLDAGRVIEMGPPSSLISGQGAFNRLWKRQNAAHRPVVVD
jgi:subfamily B ATP-binding cassette protein MsbA